MKTDYIPASWFSSVRISPPPSTIALVLAGGKGSRLKASEDEELRRTPKVLVPITRPGGTISMLGHVLTELAATGTRRIAVLTSSDPEAGGAAVERYALTHVNQAFELSIFREGRPLGTAGAVYAALRHLKSEVATVVPADTLFPFSAIPSAVAAHLESRAPVTWTVTTCPGEHAQNTGRLLLDHSSGHVIHALEGIDDDPPPEVLRSLRPATSAGVVIVRPAAYCDLFEQYAERLPKPSATDLYRQFIPWLISRGEPVGAFDVEQACPDLGTPARLHAFGR